MNNIIKQMGIKCTTTDCENNLHCFRITERLIKKGIIKGHCRSCNADLIDWERIYRHDIDDIEYLISALRLELFRNAYWDIIEIENNELQKILTLSNEELLEKIRGRISKSVSKPRSQIYRDGTQTPLSGNAIYYGQHATGTCCRKCIEEWYGIPEEVPLSDEHINYLSRVVLEYLKRKTNR